MKIQANQGNQSKVPSLPTREGSVSFGIDRSVKAVIKKSGLALCDDCTRAMKSSELVQNSVALVAMGQVEINRVSTLKNRDIQHKKQPIRDDRSKKQLVRNDKSNVYDKGNPKSLARELRFHIQKEQELVALEAEGELNGIVLFETTCRGK